MNSNLSRTKCAIGSHVSHWVIMKNVDEMRDKVMSLKITAIEMITLNVSAQLKNINIASVPILYITSGIGSGKPLYSTKNRRYTRQS